MKPQLIADSCLDAGILEEKVRKSLEKRIAEQKNFSADECEQVKKLNRGLFPKGFRIDQDTTNSLRALAMFSQLELKPNKEISSHRKFIGPLIVFIKKLSWPLVRIHLKDTVHSMQQFCFWNIDLMSQQLAEIKLLKEKIKELEEK